MSSWIFITIIAVAFIVYLYINRPPNYGSGCPKCGKKVKLAHIEDRAGNKGGQPGIHSEFEYSCEAGHSGTYTTWKPTSYEDQDKFGQ